MRHGRGQVTLFVIIGIVAVILVALLLSLVMYRVDIDPIRTVPAEFEPIRQHVLGCMLYTGTDAVKEAASHGGYIDPHEQDPPLRFDAGEPTESELILFNREDESSAVPYYFHMNTPSTCASCTYSGAQPTEEEMNEGIATYIDEHLGDCINFGVYPDFTVEPLGDREVTVTVTNESVVVLVDWLVRMQRGESTATIEQFYERIDIPLGRYRNIANELASNEAYYQFLENYLLYIISTYGGIGQPLPGISGVEEGFAPSFWIRTNVERDFRQLLYTLTPALKVIGASGVEPANATGDPYLDNFLRVSQIPAVLENDVSDVAINFHYFDQPIYLRVSPSEGELIKPRSQEVEGMLFIPPRQLNYYDFFYDVSVPFIVEIRDSQRGVSYLFALEANLRDNKHFVQWVTGHGTIPWQTDFLDFDLINQNVVSENPVSDTYTHNASVSSPLCEDELRAASFTAITNDAGSIYTGDHANARLENVSLSFRCGLLTECSLGVSLRGAYYAEWDGKLPPCEGGFVKAEKEGYLSVATEVSTSTAPGAPPLATPSRHVFNLFPFVEKRVRFEKYYLDWRGRVTSGPHDLEENDVVRLELNRHQTHWAEDPYTITVFSETEDIDVNAMESWDELEDSGYDLFQDNFADPDVLYDATGRQVPFVSLVPGTYDVSVQYYDRDGRTVEKNCEKYCYCPCWSCSAPSILGGCDEECEQIPDEEIFIEFAPWGGLELGRTSGNPPWVIYPGNLYRNEEVVIPVLIPEDICCNGGSPTNRCPGLESLERMSQNPEFTRDNPARRPRLT